MPETDKMLLLSRTFHISLDVLLKDELTVNGIKEVHSCCTNTIMDKKNSVFESILIKESIDDESILDILRVKRSELWNTGGKPKYWTVLYFTSGRKNFPEQISKVLMADPGNGGNWFADFKADNEKYIVFRDKILKYQTGNQAEKEAVCSECRKMGISSEQMAWPE